jgi:hypothetical protein
MTSISNHRSGGRATPFLDSGKHLSPYVHRQYQLHIVRSFLLKRLNEITHVHNQISYADMFNFILDCPSICKYGPILFVIGGTVRDAVYCANLPNRTKMQKYAHYRRIANDIDVTLVLKNDHNRCVKDLSTRIATWLKTKLPNLNIRNASRSGKVGHFLSMHFPSPNDSNNTLELAYIEHPNTLHKREASYFYYGSSYAYLLDSPCNTLLYEVARNTIYDPTRMGLHDATRRIWRSPVPIPKTFPWSFYKNYVDPTQSVPIKYWNADIQTCIQWVVKGRTRRNKHTGRLSWTSKRKPMTMRASKFAKKGYHIHHSTQRLLDLPLFKKI